MTDNLSRYAVIGHPVDHSLSPRIHTHFAGQTGERLTYELLPAPKDGFRAVSEQFFAAGGAGLNVTLPFKEQAAALVDSLDDAARIAGAVNTIRRTAQGTLEGFNTDGIGLLTDLQDNLGWSLDAARVLLIGAGGASRGALASLLGAGPNELVVANRTLAKAEELLRDIVPTPGGTQISSTTPMAVTGSFDVVINATSASLAGEGALVPATAVRDALCYDMLYASDATVFSSWSTSHGARATADGLGMLIEQAAAAFQLWRGVRPETGALLNDRDQLFARTEQIEQVPEVTEDRPNASRKQRFIAGAVCPQCREIDRIVIRETDQGREQACVACGYQKAEEDGSAAGGLQALVPRGKHEQPALSVTPNRPVSQQDAQPVRIVDPAADKGVDSDPKKTD